MSNVTSIKKTPGVTMDWVTVTPEQALKWLEGNVHNRKVRDSVVDRYAEDMREGRWRQTHQGIAFDEQGTLIDGQHRLWAVDKADVPVLLMVTRGLPMESQLVVDDVVKRDVVDVLKIKDEPFETVSKLHAAVAQRMFYGIGPRSTSGTRTRQELINFLKKHWEPISWTVNEARTAKKARALATAPTLAAIAKAFYHEDRAVLTRFVQVLTSGITTKDGDETVIVLRNWLLMGKRSTGDDAARENCAKTIRCLLAFCRGQAIGHGRLYGVNEDPYPLPGKMTVAQKVASKNGRRHA